MQRQALLQTLRERIARGVPIIGVGAGCGLSALCAEAYGADLIIIYNSGRFRMAGRGATAGRMPFSDANGMVLEMAEEVLPVVKKTPVIAGVFASDPYRNLERLLHTIQDSGFSGVQNFPTTGSIGGFLARDLERAGIGYGAEVEMVRLARKMELLTTPYCFDLEETKRMADAGADLIVAHMDLTSSGLIGAASTASLEDCAERITNMVELVCGINPETMVICHGGPISTPEDAQYIFDCVPGIAGFYGASAAERIPVEGAIIDATRAFKAIQIGGERHGASLEQS